MIVEENETDDEDEMNVTDEIEEMSSSSKKKVKTKTGGPADVPIADDLFDGDVIDTDVFDF